MLKILTNKPTTKNQIYEHNYDLFANSDGNYRTYIYVG
ncbi:MAG: hypothetical protein ACI8W0_000722 [Flavobacterium sp.]|jgi:hypothetical protein